MANLQDSSSNPGQGQGQGQLTLFEVLDAVVTEIGKHFDDEFHNFIVACLEVFANIDKLPAEEQNELGVTAEHITLGIFDDLEDMSTKTAIPFNYMMDLLRNLCCGPRRATLADCEDKLAALNKDYDEIWVAFLHTSCRRQLKLWDEFLDACEKPGSLTPLARSWIAKGQERHKAADARK